MNTIRCSLSIASPDSRRAQERSRARAATPRAVAGILATVALAARCGGGRADDACDARNALK